MEASHCVTLELCRFSHACVLSSVALYTRYYFEMSNSVIELVVIGGTDTHRPGLHKNYLIAFHRLAERDIYYYTKQLKM